MKQNPEDVNGGVEFAITRRELFVNVRTAAELPFLVENSFSNVFIDHTCIILSACIKREI